MHAYTEKRKKEYLLPDQIVMKSDNVENADWLLKRFRPQNMLKGEDFCRIKGKGFLVLDFGKEYFGGVRVVLNNCPCEGKNENIRIRFGESLTECCAELGEKNTTNDHSPRDMRIYLSFHSDTEWGLTGYRYIRIDFLEDGEYLLDNVFGTFLHTEEPKAEFLSSDEGVNAVWEMCARTLFLNMQNGCIWDGIKRDQHVWVGDLYPEVLTALYLYGDCEEVRNSLDRSIEAYPLPCWYNDLPTYNAWFLLILAVYFEKTGKAEEKYLQVAKENLAQFDQSVTENGEFDFARVGQNYWGPLFDWPSYETADSDYGCYCLIYYAIQTLANSEYFDEETKALAKKIANRLEKRSAQAVRFKAIEAFSALCGKSDGKTAVARLNEGGAKGYSAFISYFISKVLVENGRGRDAFNNLLQFYGGMLDAGATTVWENFDIEWLENTCKITELPKEGQKDVHGDFGAFCYQGFRHSLCHGWSCGAIPFFVEYLIGFSVVGERKIRFTPDLFGLKWVECKLPTRWGMLWVRHEEKNGEICTQVELPDGVELVK